jgi:molybdenum cofactor cytidylyltransferase
MPLFSVVILAAGASSRLGRPKQLVHFRRRPLIVHAVETALLADAQQVIVVVGFNANMIATPIREYQLDIVNNPIWSEGMGTSIHAGMAEVWDTSGVAVLMTCDQPLIGHEHIADLAGTASVGGLAATAYEGIAGVPAAFSREWFKKLERLRNHEGAKEILRKNEQVSLIDHPGAALDIDTEEDVLRLD